MELLANGVLVSNIWRMGASVTIIGYVTVLAALAILWGIYSVIPKILDWNNKYRLKKQGKQESAEKESLEISGETAAAIATALYHYFNELHDVESGRITIKKVSKTYSPWSSKIYGVNRRL